MHPVYKKKFTTEQGETVHKWANIKNPGGLQLIIVFQVEKTPFAESYFEADDKTLNVCVVERDHKMRLFCKRK